MKPHIKRIKSRLCPGWEMRYLDPYTGFHMVAYSHDFSKEGLAGALKFFRSVACQ